jgi:hypothetical protein
MEKESCTREKTISSMVSFYTLLTQLPYIPPDKLMLPPPTGWPINTEGKEEGPGINATELRNRGKNETVIDVLRHIPYLDQELYGERWTLADNTLHINYARGQLYGDYLERDTAILPLPGHIIWLTEGFERAGVYLLLNTETWEIIEYTLLGESIEIDYDAYEALPVAQKWTAYSAMPANEYFELWRWRHVTLQFVLVRDEHAFRGTGEWWCKDPRHLYEESFVQGEEADDQEEEEDEDEDYVPEDEEEGDEGSDMDTDDSDDESAGDEDEEMEDIQTELQSLSLDQPPAPTAPADHSDEASTNPRRGKSFLYKLAQTLIPDANNNNNPRANYTDPWTTARREEMKQLINIFVTHGWPVPEYEWRVSGRYITTDPTSWDLDLTNFKREQCLAALQQWYVDKQERERAERRAAAAADEAQQRRKVRSIARKLQTWFLVPTERGEEIDESIIPYAVLALVELDELEPVPDEVIRETKIHKILRGVVDCPPMKEREDLREICEQASQFLKNWEYLISQSDAEE